MSEPGAARSSSPLTRLARAFTALGIAVLIALGVLLGSALSRLEGQRALRQRMVADRVFDEVEQEITSVLQREAERPAAAYDATQTDPARWAPFVVGYYRREPELILVAPERLGRERQARVSAAVAATLAELEQGAARTDADEPPGATDPDLIDRGPRSSPDVLRQLNRSVKVRERRQHNLARTFQVVAADPTTLVIERTSPSGSRREGFVLAVPSMVRTLESWVLGAQGLDGVAMLRLTLHEGPVEGAYRFAHRLAAPLDQVHIELSLSQLDDDDAQATLIWLAALLFATAALGLLALYRMAAVQVRFAERRNNFVAAVTHELKTPLTAIRMYGEMLREGMVEDERTRQEYYATITAESERLTRLINNVMEHARLRRGERSPQLVRARLPALVREVVDLLVPHIEQEGFAHELALADDVPEAMLDVDALKQVLFNVIDNALKYGRDADPRRVQVSCAADAERAYVRVRDFGPGVPEPLLGSIFEPFFRGQDELTRRQQGTGIGLSLVRDLVRGMRGQVRARNAQPGLEIEIALPLAP